MLIQFPSNIDRRAALVSHTCADAVRYWMLNPREETSKRKCGKCSGSSVNSACYCREVVQRTGIFEAMRDYNGVPFATPNDAAAFLALMRAQVLPEPEVRRQMDRGLGAWVTM